MHTNNALQPGTLLRSPLRIYRIERELGSGGFGITYLATASIRVDNVTVKARFAIKEHFVRDDCERDPATSRVLYSNPARERVENARKDFIAEANRLHKVGVSHPNIVKVNEVFEDNNTAYYVMEFIEGESLRSYVRRKGSLSGEETLTLMEPVIDAVRTLHAAMMTHLDIKPDNIMLSQEDNGALRPVLIDFGLSKHYDKNGRPTSTVNTLACSDGYSPVEQYAGITSFSPAADIYALGCTVWFCLTGKDPKKSTDIVDGELVSQLPPAISPYLRQLVAQSTAPSRFERKLPRREKKQMPHELVPPPPPVMYGGPIPTKLFPIPAPRWSKRRIITLSAISVLLLIAIGAFFLMPSDDTLSEEKDNLEAATNLQTPPNIHKTFTVNGISFDMVHVDGGTFRMGSDDKDADSNEKPIHSVTLSDFYIGETEVTQGLWEAVMGTTVRQQRDKADKNWEIYGLGVDYPMYYISWDECQEFISRLNALTGQTFRMPSEAEWEYAARGGRKSNGYKYSGSDKIKDVAWYDGNSDNQTHPVKTKAPNELGLYDMSGNVWEWCSDWYGDYPTLPQTDPTGPSSGSGRVFRGGGWCIGASYCRVAFRNGSTPGDRSGDLGLRLVFSAD